MTTLAIIGAGSGLGAAVARRFGREGFSVALVSRNQSRLDALADDLARDGVNAQGFTADVRDPDSVQRALAQATTDLGPIEVLQYSPLPDKTYLRPVLETTHHDLVGPVEFSVYGPVAAVHQVLPGMRYLGEGRGSILFVNGGSAVTPNGAVTGTTVAFAGLSAYAQVLHDALQPEGIAVSQLVIGGAIEPGSKDKDPEVLAETLWGLHTGRTTFRTQVSQD